MKFRVSHTTQYDYAGTVSMCFNQAHLTPRSFDDQVCRSSHLEIIPAPIIGQRRRDYFGNEVTYFTVQEPHKQLFIRVNSEVDLLQPRTLDPSATPPWECVAESLHSDHVAESLDAAQYTFASAFVRPGHNVRDYTNDSFPTGRPVLAGVLDLTHRIHRDFIYDPTATTVSTPLEDVLKNRRGVCQDFAHLQIACLRSLGLAARYVSGYILSAGAGGEQHLTGSQASHAWVSVYIPGSGWVDIDPTNNMIRGVEHITLAWGRDYEDVCPIRGVVLGGGDHKLSVDVNIVPVNKSKGQ